MPRQDDDYEDYDEADTEDPAASDMDDDSADEGTVACPHCGREIYETAERCPKCGVYVTRDEHATTRMPLWIILTAVLLMVLIVAGAVRYL